MTQEPKLREKVEEIYENLRTLGENGHPYGYGDLNCSSENEGDVCCIEKGKEILIESVTNLLLSDRAETIRVLREAASNARHEAGQLGLDPNATMDCIFEALDESSKELTK